MNKLIGGLLRNPSDSFCKFLIKELDVFDGMVTANVIKRFEPIIKKSLQITLVDMMTRSLSQQMSQPADTQQQASQTDTEQETEQSLTEESIDSQVETTAEELQVFEIVKQIVQASKQYRLEVKYKDVLSYFGLHLGNSTWWFLRFYLTPKKKSFITRLSVDEAKVLAPNFEIQELSAPQGGAASRVVITSIDDLHKLSPLIIRCYELESAKHP